MEREFGFSTGNSIGVSSKRNSPLSMDSIHRAEDLRSPVRCPKAKAGFGKIMLKRGRRETASSINMACAVTLRFPGDATETVRPGANQAWLRM